MPSNDDEQATPPSASDVDPFESDALSGDVPDDLGEGVTAEWKESATSFQRINAVLRNTYEPHTTGELAEKTATTKPTVRKHVEPLVEAGMVVEQTSATGTQYVWNETQRRVNRVAELAEARTPSDLDAKIKRAKTRLAEFEREYGVDSPNELAGRLDPDDDAGWDDLSTWRTLEADLKRLKAVQVMGEYLDDPESGTAGTDVSNHA